MSLIRKIAVNNLILISERLLLMAAGILVSFWLMRYLGPEKFGTYSLVFAWFTLLNVFTPPMIEQVVAREAVRFPNRMRQFLGAGIVIKTVLSLAGWLAGVCAVYFLGYPRQTIFFLAIVLLGLLGNSSYVLQVPHQIELRLLKPALADGLSNLFYQAGRTVMIVLKMGLLPFFWLYLVFRAFQLALFFALGLEKKEYRPDWRFSYHEVSEIFRASWVLLIINIFLMIISRIDQLMIYPVWGARAVGLYGSCANLTDYLITIPSVWYLTVFPLITRYLGESQDSFQKVNQYSFKYLTIAAVLLWIIFAGFGRDAFQMFLPDYVDAKDALFWLSTSMVSAFIYLGLFNIAVSRGKEKVWIAVSAAGALINIALNWILIPRYGIAGAGFATFSAYSLQIILCGIFKDFRPDFILMLKSTLWPIMLGIAIIAATKLFELSLISWLAPAIIVYSALLLLTRTINEKDLKMAWKAFRPGNNG